MVGPKPARASVSKACAEVAVRWLALCLLTVGLAACQTKPPTLSDLKGLEELKDRFNRDAGKTRIVLIVSPT